jgi:hypothetical protein
MVWPTLHTYIQNPFVDKQDWKTQKLKKKKKVFSVPHHG